MHAIQLYVLVQSAGNMEHLSFVLLLILAPLAFADLQLGFYNSTCPNAESIVKDVVSTHFSKDPSVTAALLRMHFHDCFVRGCDASILIDSKNSEKTGGADKTVREFDLIDEAKEKLEAECPSVVSCADIVALATRDSVFLAGGLSYSLPTGRRDGLKSIVQETSSLPSPSTPIPKALKAFGDKGFTAEEMVTLLGAHTVGVAHCFFLPERLKNTLLPMNATLRENLRGICGKDRSQTTFLDHNTSFVVDNEYYKQIILGNGILTIDQRLALHESTARFVTGFASDGTLFLRKFADAMVKLGSVDVLVGNEGEIRNKCRAFNKPAK